MEETPITNALDHKELIRIIHNNRQIRQKVQQATDEFLTLQNDLLQDIQKEKFHETIEQKSKPLIDVSKIQSLNKQVTADKLQLALVGENSSGKTSLIHLLLDADSFLPSDVGSVSARIICLTYAENINACLRIYPSLNDRHKEPDEQISLSKYFSESQPNWSGVKDAIAPHVHQPNPKNIEKNSEEFAKWAKYFVEIQIPATFLKLGIDLYDTPGLLFSDPLVLKQNIHDLVKTIVPTIVFMYENASVTSDTQDCFLALKEALGKQLDYTSIFFLNTKVDIGTIIADGVEINDEEFENKTLTNARQERKNLLLEAPGMAQQISEGGEFNIVSVESQWDRHGVKMNQLTIDHLVQFVANSDLKIAKRVSELVLSIINSFFDFAFVANHRTREQLQDLRRNAYQWTEKYFNDNQRGLDELLRKLYDAIINELNDKMDSIARKAANQDTAEMMEKYIRTLIHHEIVKVIVNKFMEEHTTLSLFHTFMNPSVLNNADKNEFLDAAQQLFLHRPSDMIDETFYHRYIHHTIMIPLFFIINFLIESNEEDDQTYIKKNPKWNELKKKLRKVKIPKSNRQNGMEKLDIAQQYLNDIRSEFINQKTYINQIVIHVIESMKNELKEQINQHYELTEKFLSEREKAYDLANKYAEQFAHIECKLIGARCLISFKGHSPTLNSMEEVFIDEDKFFKFYLAEWLDKKDLIVKKLETASNLQYLEAHYCYKLSKLGIPDFLPLLYIYQNDDSELWMFFPKCECLENKISTVTIKNALKIVLATAKCLERLHANELIHGSINVKNIYITNDDKYLLGDFYSKGTYENLKDYVNRHKMNKIFEAFADDIYSLGEFGMFLYGFLETNDRIVEILDQFKSLLEKCLDQGATSRPKAAKIIEILNHLLEKV